MWWVVCALALVSAGCSLVVFATHVPDFFMGDDFELIGDALAGVSPWEPVATHLRPVVRLHFQLYRWIPSAAFFGALSVVLHALASGAVFLALRETHGRLVAIPSALFFFSCFLANEVVFWSSSSAVLYCTIFSCLALAAFARGRVVLACLGLIPAALSYELWLVVPPLFLFHYRRARELIAPFAMAGAYLALHLFTFGAAGASSYGGFSFTELPERFAIYAYRLLSPLAGTPSLAASLALSLLLLTLFAFRGYRWPATLYLGSALIFSLSSHVSSRFYYFPSLALVVVVSLGVLSARRPARVAAAAVAIYLAVASPWINGLDGEDYLQKARLHEQLYEAFAARIDLLGAGDSAVVVNRLGPEPLEALAASRVGRPKLIYVRGPAMAGMIYPDDAVRMALWDRDERPREAPCAGAMIDVGRSGPVRSRYCFQVAPR
jgi:hypothetical protein